MTVQYVAAVALASMFIAATIIIHSAWRTFRATDARQTMPTRVTPPPPPGYAQRLDMHTVFVLACKCNPSITLTSNQAHALAQAINKEMGL